MYSCGSCFLWSCFSSQNYRWSSCKMEVRLGSCVGVGLTSGTAVEETDYRQTPTSPAARWLSQRNDQVEEIVVARTPRNMVSDGSRAGGVCRTPGRECLFWPMPPYYSYYLLLLYSTSIEDSRCWLRTANTLTYGPPHTVGKFPGVCARLKSVLCEDGWLVSSLKLVVLHIRRRRDSAAILEV